MAKQQREKKIAVLVHLTPDQLLKIEWFQEHTPATRALIIRKALDEYLADVRPPGIKDRP